MAIDTRKALLGCGAALMALCLSGQAVAQQRIFSIPAQDATTAIGQFGLQARVQIIAPTDQLRGARTRALRGEMDMRRALALLLRGTGLEVASNDGQVIVLRRAGASRRGRAGQGVGAVAGSVLDPATGDYLRNAIIRINGRQAATSGRRGEFRVNNVPAGAARLSVEFTGYTTRTLSVNVVAGAVARQNIELRSSLADPLSDAGTVEVDEVVVMGAREGDARAIMEQRASMNIVNTLSADSFGEISDGNPAEFLKYMPGVDFDLVADDVPRNISLRGLHSRYTRVIINGRMLAGGADANTSTTSPTSRQYSFEQLALTSIDTISVFKTSSADMDANAPAGTIDIRTRKAFDRRGRSITAQLGGSTHRGLWDRYRTGWQEGGYGGRRFLPMAQITYADVFLDGRLGVTAGVSDMSTLIEHVQTTAGRNYMPTAVSPDPYAVTTIGGAYYNREYNRQSASLGLDFKATDNLVLSLAANYNRGDIDSSTIRPTFTTHARSRGVVGDGDAALDFTTDAAETANTLSLVQTHNYKFGDTISLVPSFEWSNGRFSADGYIFYSNSESQYDEGRKGYVYSLLNGLTARGNFSAVRSDLLTQDWKIQQVTGPDWSDPAHYEIGMLNGSNRPQVLTRIGSSVQADMVGASFNFLFDGRIGAVPVTWKMGLKFTRGAYEYANANEALQWTYNGPLSNTEFLRSIQSVNEISFANSGMKVTTLNGGGLYVYSLAKIYELMRAHPDQWSNDMTAANWYSAYVENTREYEEDIRSVYVMGTADLSRRLRLQAGLRLEQTVARSYDFDPLSAQDVVKAGHAVDPATGRAATIAGLQYQYLTHGKVERRGDHTDVFPSASIKYGFTDSLDLIAGYSRTIQRPDVSLLAGVRSVAFLDEGTVVSAPNPNLKSEYADNFSVRLVRYFEPVGLVSVNYYYNRIHNGIVSRQFTAEEFGYEGTEYADAIFESYSNSSDQEINIHGYELEFSHALEYLPGVLRGLSVRGSWLYNDPDVIQERVATQVRQFGVSWRNGPARLDLNTVWSNEKSRGLTNSIATPSGVINQSQPFIPYLEVNLSGSYTIIKKTRDNFMGLEAYFSANNILNNHRGTWYANDEVWPGARGRHSQIHIYSGQRAALGLRARF